MKKVILGIGIPGSGKTTLLRSFGEKNTYMYVCPDDIRLEMTGDAADQSKNKEVWEEAYKRTENYLKEGKTVVFDATFANVDQRRAFIDFSRQKGADRVEGVFVDVTLEVAKERNLLRGKEGGRNVPEYVLENMRNQITSSEPGLVDGLDAIFQLNEEGKLIQSDFFREGRYLSKKFV